VKKISVAIFAPVIVGVAASLVSYFPSYFHLPPEWAKFVTSIPTVGAMATGGIIFFDDSREMTNRDWGSLQEDKWNAFKSWLNTTTELRHQVDTFPDSFMPLYVDIISKIKSPGRYRQAKAI
jgi:hypothetical protein